MYKPKNAGCNEYAGKPFLDSLKFSINLGDDLAAHAKAYGKDAFNSEMLVFKNAQARRYSLVSLQR